ncbi:MAG TPA: NUDIX domain-containing protein [Chlamydiales bacterium]|nr:NUDIX domain-containing protein [Chlamydiales bacterium]
MEQGQSLSIGWHVPIGVGILIMKEGKVLMLKRAYKNWGFGVVAGELEKGESLRQSIVRHAKKEVGINIQENDVRFLCVVHYKTQNAKEAPVVFFFTTEKWVGEPFNKEPERHSEWGWFDIHQHPDHLAPGEKLVLDAYKNRGITSVVYVESGWAENN